MGPGSSNLRLIYAFDAIDELDAIWNWNAARYDEEHASRYVDFVRAEIERLVQLDGKGVRIDGYPGLETFTIRKRRAKYAHIAVIRRDETLIEVLPVFHTAQDWPKLL